MPSSFRWVRQSCPQAIGLMQPFPLVACRGSFRHILSLTRVHAPRASTNKTSTPPRPTSDRSTPMSFTIKTLVLKRSMSNIWTECLREQFVLYLPPPILPLILVPRIDPFAALRVGPAPCAVRTRLCGTHPTPLWAPHVRRFFEE